MSKQIIDIVCAVIVRDGKYLITQRMPKAVFPLLWEFPGGQVESGESKAEALRRELHYRLGVTAVVGDEISVAEREYEQYVVLMTLYFCDIKKQDPQAQTVNSFAWVASKEFEQYSFAPADEASMEALLFGDHSS